MNILKVGDYAIMNKGAHIYRFTKEGSIGQIISVEDINRKYRIKFNKLTGPKIHTHKFFIAWEHCDKIFKYDKKELKEPTENIDTMPIEVATGLCNFYDTDN